MKIVVNGVEREETPAETEEREALQADLSSGPSQPALPAFTYKTDIWRRCTDEEAAILDDALFNAPPRLRRLWDDCTRLEHAAPEFQTLLDQAAVAFTPARAAVIFATSEG